MQREREVRYDQQDEHYEQRNELIAFTSGCTAVAPGGLGSTIGSGEPAEPNSGR